MPVAVEIDNLVVRYGEKTAVDGLSLTVTGGTVTSVLGPNGAGKTTTVESCGGFRRPESGRVRVLGLDPITDHDELMPRIGVMLQEGGAWSGVRALEMLKYMATLHTHPLDVPALVERLDLGSCGRTPYRRLSGGQKQRLSFALAIIGRPEVAFLDEPTTGLDPHGRREIWQLIRDLREDGVTVVLTTHAMDEAEQLSDQVYVVSAGKVIASGTPDALTEHHTKSLEDVFLELTSPRQQP
ncbi:ABC transporter ATP-binding protein [Kribbella sp. NPDC055071]